MFCCFSILFYTNLFSFGVRLFLARGWYRESVPHQTQFQPPPADVRQHCLSQWATPNTIRQPRDPERRQKVTFRIKSAPGRFIIVQSNRPNDLFPCAALLPLLANGAQPDDTNCNILIAKWMTTGPSLIVTTPATGGIGYELIYLPILLRLLSSRRLRLTGLTYLVYLVPWQRILLRDRRGVPNRPLQPDGPQHRGAILPVCARPYHRCLRRGLRR